MRGGARQLDMRHALAPHLGLGNLDATLFTDDTAMLEALVLATQTFVGVDRSEYLGSEKAVTLGHERSVVDVLGLLYLSE